MGEYRPLHEEKKVHVINNEVHVPRIVKCRGYIHFKT